MTEDNSIFVGQKPFMNYVTSVVMQFTTKNADEVIVKARGKFSERQLKRQGKNPQSIRLTADLAIS